MRAEAAGQQQDRDSLVGVFESCADSHDACGLVGLDLRGGVEYFGESFCCWYGGCSEVLVVVLLCLCAWSSLGGG